jgi:hypothetical protein
LKQNEAYEETEVMEAEQINEVEVVAAAADVDELFISYTDQVQCQLLTYLEERHEYFDFEQMDDQMEFEVQQEQHDKQ